MTLSSLLELVFSTLTPVSRVRYTNAWGIFTKAAKVKTIDDLRGFTGLKLLKVKEQLDVDYKPASVSMIFAVVRRVVRTGVLHEILPKDFTVGVETPVGDNVPHWNVLQPGEFEKLAKVLPKGSMERAIVLALAMQGLRADELCSRNWGHVGADREGPTLQVMGKRGKFQLMGLQKEVLGAAMAWAKAQGQKTVDPARPFIAGPRGKRLTRGALNKLINRLTQEHLGHRVTPHGLRATFISDVISRHGIERARQLARHSSIVVTQRYSRWSSIRDDPRVLR